MKGKMRELVGNNENSIKSDISTLINCYRLYLPWGQLGDNERRFATQVGQTGEVQENRRIL